MHELFPTDSLGSLIPAPVGDYQPDMKLETRLAGFGHQIVAGIDEAGRGPLAGPVVAAAVILNAQHLPKGLDDSKSLSPKRREELFAEILEHGEMAVSAKSAQTIDAINIRQATLACMNRAAMALAIRAHWHLIDGKDIPLELRGKATAIIKGDGRSMSVAAASIVAKVIRDAIMSEAANTYPEYEFERHKGYGTKTHRLAIEKYGPCPLHRMSFAPLKYII